MSKTKKQEIGKWGEDRAVLFLEQKGYIIIDRNVLIQRGEIDIIAWHDKYHNGRTLCFVEVKTRTYGVGTAERATVVQKLNVLMRTAKYYCIRQNIDMDAIPIQFEQVSVYINKKKGTVSMKIHEILM